MGGLAESLDGYTAFRYLGIVGMCHGLRNWEYRIRIHTGYGTLGNRLDGAYLSLGVYVLFFLAYLSMDMVHNDYMKDRICSMQASL